jgi:hypothetical protein
MPQTQLCVADTYTELAASMRARHSHEPLRLIAGYGANHREPQGPQPSSRDASPARPRLQQWPIQLYLISPDATFLQHADLALVASCAPFAGAFSGRTSDSAIAIGCPKLDADRCYVHKLAEILQQADIRSLKVVRMEVPCCGGLEVIARDAIAQSGALLPLTTEIVCMA